MSAGTFAPSPRRAKPLAQRSVLTALVVLQPLPGHSQFALEAAAQVPVLPVQPSMVMSPPLPPQPELVPPCVAPEAVPQAQGSLAPPGPIEPGLPLQPSALLQLQPDLSQPLGQQLPAPCSAVAAGAETSQEVEPFLCSNSPASALISSATAV